MNINKNNNIYCKVKKIINNQKNVLQQLKVFQIRIIKTNKNSI